MILYIWVCHLAQIKRLIQSYTPLHKHKSKKAEQADQRTKTTHFSLLFILAYKAFTVLKSKSIHILPKMAAW